MYFVEVPCRLLKKFSFNVQINDSQRCILIYQPIVRLTPRHGSPLKREFRAVQCGCFSIEKMTFKILVILYMYSMTLISKLRANLVELLFTRVLCVFRN